MESDKSTSRWLGWPAPEALTRIGVPRVRLVLDAVLFAAISCGTVVSAYLSGAFPGWYGVLPPLGLALAVAAIVAYHRTTHANQLARSLGLLAAVAGLGLAAHVAGAHVSATLLWIVVSVTALERLPLLVALATVLVLSGGFVDADETGVLGAGVTTVAVLLTGYSLRLDAEARSAGFRLLTQERAAREAEAASAALAERARIAREIHDVLAHSLSAQMVHLEAARLQIEAGAERETILERVVAARAMAREGLAETRQALSALRGDVAPVEDYLWELAREDRAEVRVVGARRQLPAEASQAVRRVAQEALTNVRKHAPGARTRVLFAYGAGEVALEVRDSGVPGAASAAGTVGVVGASGLVGGAGLVDGAGLSASGSGYGLLGMRERAELLGGTLDAGPEGDGFAVRLRVPA
ncbi:histidine kinase [Streptomyces sp. NPDC050848]|uniref:sensor histidine kinase n=1 Tax=Streptomyces sp. NPDC050848 TaxID=3155791 RepID=UPI0034039135